ncbi:P-loop containing nucleoside triphosphate hydrolase protein [Terfezia claveryi]|nr:P-loop containing nucleoside triphosphate hydrolase protein [Terfezia claveryi]
MKSQLQAMAQDAPYDENRFPKASIDAILDGLNEAQHSAVINPAPIVQILAPPGSGKTRTLTSRVAYLLAHHGYNPSNIIVATFTVKAAREMKDRIGKLIGNGLERKLILGTFHSIARRYLVRYGHLIGLKKGFGIADGNDSQTIIKRIIKRNQVTIEASSSRSRISHIKAQGLSFDDYVMKHEKATKKDLGAQEFVVVYREYQDGLEQANLLDYDDLLLRCVDLLKAHPEVTKNVEAVLVDEFQDTNLVQFDLMRGFAKWRKRVTIVGDPDQSIYGFRAAEIKNLKRMQLAYPDTLVVVLAENYRSSASILQSAQVVIEQDESRPDKALLPTHQVGTRPVLRYLKDAAQEAQWIVMELKRVITLTGNAITPNDVAILVRSAAQTRHIESALAQNGIAYKMAGGLKFYDRVEVKTVLDYLRVIHNPGNNDALARVVNIPPRRIGQTTVKALLEEGFRKKKSLWEVIKGGVRGELRVDTKVTKTAEQGLAGFVNVVLTARKMLFEEETEELVDDGGLELEIGWEATQRATLVDIVYYLMKKLSYKEYLEKHYPEDNDTRWANIEELVVQAADFTHILAMTISEEFDEEALPSIDGIEQQRPSAMADALDRFLANVALVNEVQEGEDEESAVPRERVTISTIHSAKGLEWPVVFIPGCYDGSIPHSRCDDTDEERRLLYVAMTRAMGLLYMSCPRKNSKYEKSVLSQFLKSPKVLKLLENKGPALTPVVTQGVLQILGRECPAIVMLNEAAMGLESLEDDLFPVGDGMDSDEEVGEDWGASDGRGGKRRRVDERGNRSTSYGWGSREEQGAYGRAQRLSTGVGVRAGTSNGGFISERSITTASNYTSYTTTMSAAASFSANTTFMGGFKSARGHLDELRERQVGAESDVARHEMRRVHEALSTKSVFVEKQVEKTAPAVAKKTSRTGQGNLLEFFKKAPTSAAGKVVGKHQGAVKSLQVATKDGFVLLSSSPVKIRPSPPPLSWAKSQPLSKSSHVADENNVHEELQIPIDISESTLPPEPYIPDSDGEEGEDPFDYLPPPLPQTEPELLPSQVHSNPKPTTIPNSDPDPADPDTDDEEAYREVELLDTNLYEPVLPKPFLTRTGSVSAERFAAAQKARVRLVDSAPLRDGVLTEQEVAPMLNRAAVRAIREQGQGQGQDQQKRTLGIRRSMNGWESRGGRSGGPSLAGLGVGSGVRKTGTGTRGRRGGGFVRQLLG